MTAQGILSHAVDQSDVSRLNEAMEFLREALAPGEREVDEVRAEAKRCGIADQTLRRARELLKIRPRREGAPNTKQRFYWALPGDAVQDGGDDVH